VPRLTQLTQSGARSSDTACGSQIRLSFPPFSLENDGSRPQRCPRTRNIPPNTDARQGHGAWRGWRHLPVASRGARRRIPHGILSLLLLLPVRLLRLPVLVLTLVGLMRPNRGLARWGGS